MIEFIPRCEHGESNAKEFKIRWWDLKRDAQRRLLSSIFGSEPIATTTIDMDIADEEEYICEIDADGDCIDCDRRKSMKGDK